MISKLNNANNDVARQIFNIFQHAYSIEAELIGVTNFPPLLRTVEDIRNSTSQFFGYQESKSLAAIIEIVIHSKQLEINSLTVAPEYFRKGIAGKLMHYILTEFNCSTAKVETAAVNIPAISLYKKYGFVEINRWTPAHGIKKVAMSAQIPF